MTGTFAFIFLMGDTQWLEGQSFWSYFCTDCNRPGLPCVLSLFSKSKIQAIPVHSNSLGGQVFILPFFRSMKWSFPCVQLQGSDKALEQGTKQKNFLCKSSSRTFLRIPQPQLAFSQRASPAEASGVLLTHSTTQEVDICLLNVGWPSHMRLSSHQRRVGRCEKSFQSYFH